MKFLNINPQNTITIKLSDQRIAKILNSGWIQVETKENNPYTGQKHFYQLDRETFNPMNKAKGEFSLVDQLSFLKGFDERIQIRQAKELLTN